MTIFSHLIIRFATPIALFDASPSLMACPYHCQTHSTPSDAVLALLITCSLSSFHLPARSTPLAPSSFASFPIHTWAGRKTSLTSSAFLDSLSSSPSLRNAMSTATPSTSSLQELFPLKRRAHLWSLAHSYPWASRFRTPRLSTPLTA